MHVKSCPSCRSGASTLFTTPLRRFLSPITSFSQQHNTAAFQIIDRFAHQQPILASLAEQPARSRSLNRLASLAASTQHIGHRFAQPCMCVALWVWVRKKARRSGLELTPWVGVCRAYLRARRGALGASGAGASVVTGSGLLGASAAAGAGVGVVVMATTAPAVIAVACASVTSM
jgi:hypothetical protein